MITAIVLFVALIYTIATNQPSWGIVVAILMLVSELSYENSQREESKKPLMPFLKL